MATVDLKARLDPQMAAAMARDAELVTWPAPVSELPVAESRRLYKQGRAWWNAGRPELPAVERREIMGPVGPVPLRVYYPSEQRPLPGLVYAHGGGWVLGDLDTHDKIMRRLALAAGMAVVGIDYTLSPEVKFPVAIEETVALFRVLRERGGDWGLDPARLAMAGDSAGANMTVGVALMLKDEAHELIKAALLYYGSFGLAESESRRLYGGPEDGLSAADMAFYSRAYLHDPADARDPRRNNLLAEVSGLPPMFLAAAELDPLHDDSPAFAAHLEAAGVSHELKSYAGVLHGFLHYSRMVDKASEALEDGAAFLRRVLELPAPA